jgi:predicted AAA+ superfamily ATPase
LRRISAFLFSEDYGKLAENLVFQELLRKGYEIYYWKNKNEVDFIAKKDSELLGINDKILSLIITNFKKIKTQI